MTTGEQTLKPNRRTRIRVIATVSMATLVIVALSVTAIDIATGSTAATATPDATASASPYSAPSPTDVGTAAPTTDPSPTPSAVPSPTPTPVRSPVLTETYVAKGTEPTVTADPFHPGVLAIASQNVHMTSAKAGCSIPAIRVSKDGGATWAAPTYPWGAGCQDIHSIVAWGPNSRLWAGDAIGVTGGVAMSTSHSDDFGAHWSAPVVQRFTKPWSGCFPAIAVDTWPESPNFGAVYVSYNWLPNSYGPGVAVMASRDGSNWAHTEVALSTLPKYPYGWRIGYRIKAAPDGTAFVSFYQGDLKAWHESSMLDQGGPSNIGRMGFEISHIHFTGQTLTADNPYWATNVDHTEAEWDSALAVDDSGRPWLAVESEGRISLGNGSGGWRQFEVSDKYSFKPSLAISGKNIFLGWHAQDPDGNTWTYYTLSYDGGLAFLPPARVTNTSWYDSGGNGVGLRECADASGGVFYYAYGDNRAAGSGVYISRIVP
ncbi:MAG TPA: hypothetical protein VF375_10150 [Candidatus Limnocylindrales bacterium]